MVNWNLFDIEYRNIKMAISKNKSCMIFAHINSNFVLKLKHWINFDLIKNNDTSSLIKHVFVSLRYV